MSIDVENEGIQGNGNEDDQGFTLNDPVDLNEDFPVLYRKFLYRVVTLLKKPKRTEIWNEFQELYHEIIDEMHKIVPIPRRRDRGPVRWHEIDLVDTTATHRAYKLNRKSVIRAIVGEKSSFSFWR